MRSSRSEPHRGPTARATTWLGLDLGGTKVALRLETEGEEVRELIFPWRGCDPASDLAQLSAEIRTLREQLPLGFLAVGVALPATVGTDGLVSAWPSRPEWVGLDVRRAFYELFGGAPVRWADDGDLGALAEAQAVGCDNVLYVGVGTGVGGGLVVGGVPWPGLDRGSFEIGHMVTDADGPACRCGRRGCLQASASGQATLDRAARLRGAAVTYDDLRLGVLTDAEWAIAAVDRSCHRLAVAITGVRELAHPSLVVVGGGFATGLPGFVDTVAHHVAALGRSGALPPPVRGPRCRGLSTLHGAVALARMIGPSPVESAPIP